MGLTASQLKSNVGDFESEKQINDTFNALVQVAQFRLHKFHDHVTGPNFETGNIPLAKVHHKYQFLFANVGKDQDEISSVISENLSGFVAGDSAGGVVATVADSISYLTKNYQNNASTTTFHTLVAGELGGLTRIDFELYSYEFTSRLFGSTAKNAFVATLVISTPKISDFTFHDITRIVETVYESSDLISQRKIRDQLWDAIVQTKIAGNPVDDADFDALFKGTQNYDINDIAKSVPAPGVPASSLYLVIDRKERVYVNGDSAFNQEAKNLTRKFAESLKAFLVGWLVAYARTLTWKSVERPDISIDYTISGSDVAFNIEIINVRSLDRTRELVAHQTEEGLRYLQSHPSVDPIASDFETWRFLKPVGSPVVATTPLEFTREHLFRLFQTLDDENPIVTAEQITHFIIEAADAFTGEGTRINMQKFAFALGDALNAGPVTKSHFDAIYTVLKLVIAGLNHFSSERKELRSSHLSAFWPWLNRQHPGTEVLIDTSLPKVYSRDFVKAPLPVGSGVAYLLGRLYLDDLLSREILVGVYDEVFRQVKEYTQNPLHPDFAVHIARHLVEGRK